MLKEFALVLSTYVQDKRNPKQYIEHKTQIDRNCFEDIRLYKSVKVACSYFDRLLSMRHKDSKLFQTTEKVLKEIEIHLVPNNIPERK